MEPADSLTFSLDFSQAYTGWLVMFTFFPRYIRNLGTAPSLQRGLHLWFPWLSQVPCFLPHASLDHPQRQQLASVSNSLVLLFFPAKLCCFSLLCFLVASTMVTLQVGGTSLLPALIARISIGKSGLANICWLNEYPNTHAVPEACDTCIFRQPNVCHTYGRWPLPEDNHMGHSWLNLFK